MVLTGCESICRAVALTALAGLLIPVYRLRNERWVAPSTRVLRTVEFAAAHRPGGGRFILLDEPPQPVDLVETFGDLFPDAVVLYLGPRWAGQIGIQEDSALLPTMVFRRDDRGVVPVVGR